MYQRLRRIRERLPEPDPTIATASLIGVGMVAAGIWLCRGWIRSQTLDWGSSAATQSQPEPADVTRLRAIRGTAERIVTLVDELLEDPQFTGNRHRRTFRGFAR